MILYPLPLAKKKKKKLKNASEFRVIPLQPGTACLIFLHKGKKKDILLIYQGIITSHSPFP